jgi:GPH family glycoside/pentoside/hexuronide:cation symporter
MAKTQPSNGQLLAWAGPCLPYAAIGLPLAVYLPHYYATYIGVPLGVVGSVFLLVRSIDIFFDPIVGWAMDRTRNRFGPYRTWITLGTPILGLAIWMIFMAHKGVDRDYLFTWLLVLYLGFSITTLAQLAWGAVLAPQYDQRSRLYGWWQAFNILGVLIALAIPVAVDQFKLGDYGAGVRAMGGFIVIALPLTLLLNLAVVPEPKNVSAKPHGALKAWAALIMRPTVRKVLWCDLFLGLAPGLTGTLLFFYFEFIKGFSHSQSEQFMAVYFVAGLLAAPLWSWLAMKLGKHRALMIASVVFALFYATVAFIPTGDVRMAMASLFLAGLPYAAGLLLTRAMMADVADEVRLDTGEDRMGLLFSFLSLTTKLGYAISVGSLVILDYAGFEETLGTANGPNARLALQILFIVLPTLLLVASAWTLRGYLLTPKRHAEIRAALEARDAAA